MPSLQEADSDPDHYDENYDEYAEYVECERAEYVVKEVFACDNCCDTGYYCDYRYKRIRSCKKCKAHEDKNT